MRHAIIDGILVVRPTREDVQNLKVGDMAPNCFGKMAAVVSIFAQRDDIKGKAFVCYYTENGPGSTISGSMKEDETFCSIPVTAKWHRTENVPVVA